MANDWLRLWHDMPNDPKWKTISRISGQPITLVLAVYVHLLVDASQNVTRGHVTVTNEDIASALCVTDAEIDAVISAMEGRVIDDKYLTGWERRQPKKEDAGNPESGAKSATERKREQREREKLQKKNKVVTESHGESRNVTLDTEEDTDTDTDNKNIKKIKQKKSDLDYSVWPSMPDQQILNDWHEMRKRIKANVSQTVINGFGKELHAAARFGYTVDQCLTECITRNWRGFKFEWLQNSMGAGNAANQQRDVTGTGQVKPCAADIVRSQARQLIDRLDGQAGGDGVYPAI